MLKRLAERVIAAMTRRAGLNTPSPTPLSSAPIEFDLDPDPFRSKPYRPE
ncbi:hypothetical protein [Mycolicibacterium mageritense]|uniref:Uncharacterized protein n=1 Tax=Mycolicibacterium mageritense TaxID=53462 RepID=A0ABM7I6D1_MYCME|nr:hypothetical protein [Mycolicibacterium mageritense]BBX35982.1 hypothetical protein MMAGJ_52640 [Mycolicibacterium mageritense]BBX38522.1 hypothetical protein MMAGJ_78040 [Mycolicibacterium mageritense]